MSSLKNIKIDEEIHNQLKVFCAERGLKVGKFVETIILSSIDKGDQDNEETTNNRDL